MGELQSDHCRENMKFLLIASILIAAEARPQEYAPAPETYPDEPAVYSYTYGVADDYSQNNYGQSESRDGYNTQGEYFVNLPDGRLQGDLHSRWRCWIRRRRCLHRRGSISTRASRRIRGKKTIRAKIIHSAVTIFTLSV